MIALPDGKILAVGSGDLVRYNADGSLDSTFGTDGVAHQEGVQQREPHSGNPTGRSSPWSY